MTRPRAEDGASILPLELDRLGYEVGGRRLIDGLSARLEAGPRTLILGANGAGKSLSLRLAHGLLAPTSGAVRWCGSGGQRARRRQAMVFERPVLLRRSAAANVDYALGLHGVPRRQRRARVARVLEKTGLSALADRPARVLSAGEQQRLAVAHEILDRAAALGIPAEDIIFDPLMLAVGAEPMAGQVGLETIRLLRTEMDANITVGASNVSFGMPDRGLLNRTFMAMAIASGVNCPISHPAHLCDTILAADVLLGRDEFGMRYIKACRAKRSRE